jgi:hypothetical protein
MGMFARLTEVPAENAVPVIVFVPPKGDLTAVAPYALPMIVSTDSRQRRHLSLSFGL